MQNHYNGNCREQQQQARRAGSEFMMFTLWDLSLTVDYGEVVDESEAYNVMYEEGLTKAVITGYVDGEEFEKELSL